MTEWGLKLPIKIGDTFRWDDIDGKPHIHRVTTDPAFLKGSLHFGTEVVDTELDQLCEKYVRASDAEPDYGKRRRAGVAAVRDAVRDEYDSLDYRHCENGIHECYGAHPELSGTCPWCQIEALKLPLETARAPRTFRPGDPEPEDRDTIRLEGSDPVSAGGRAIPVRCVDGLWITTAEAYWNGTWDYWLRRLSTLTEVLPAEPDSNPCPKHETRVNDSDIRGPKWVVTPGDLIVFHDIIIGGSLQFGRIARLPHYDLSKSLGWTYSVEPFAPERDSGFWASKTVLETSIYGVYSVEVER